MDSQHVKGATRVDAQVETLRNKVSVPCAASWAWSLRHGNELYRMVEKNHHSGSYWIWHVHYIDFNQPSGLASNFHLWNQDPTVFEGTIRFNIDPFDEFPDARLWEAVQSVQLMPYIRTLAVTWPLVALSDGMSWEGTYRTSKYSKCIKMYQNV